MCEKTQQRLMDAGYVVEVGERVSCEGFSGTIKYIGEVPPNSGDWWGIEWDDGSRGKHDGSHNGTKYFTTTLPNRGSFVRPTKCSLGISLMEAVRQKYVAVDERARRETHQDDESLPVDEQIIGTVTNRSVVFVGVSNIIKEQSSLESLKHINVRKCCVSSAEVKSGCARRGNSDLLSQLPSVIEIDLSENLFSDWNEIEKIVERLPLLKIISLQGNVFSKGLPSLSVALDRLERRKDRRSCHVGRNSRPDGQEIHQADQNCKPTFFCHQSVREICLNNLSLDWETILCMTVFIAPHLKTLVASFNNVTSVDPDMCVKISDMLHWRPLSTVTSLNLEGNPLGSWQEVLKLDVVMPRLETLVLNSCCLSEVYFPHTEEESATLPANKTKTFPHLVTLSLSRNKISAWESVNELEKLQALMSLNMTSNPLDKGTASWERWGHKVAARIGALTILNRVKIDRFEKRGAEIDYLNHCARELDGAEATEAFFEKHPRYLELVKKYGKPEVTPEGPKMTEVKAGLLNVNVALVAPAGQCRPAEEVLSVVTQRLPKTMTIGRLKIIVKKIFAKELGNFIKGYTNNEIKKVKDDCLSLTYSSSAKANQDILLTSERSPKSDAPVDSSTFVPPGSLYEVPMDDMFKDISYYSLRNGDTVYVRYSCL